MRKVNPYRTIRLGLMVFSGNTAQRSHVALRASDHRLMRFLMLNWRDPANPMAGGAERVSLAYLAALVKRGHEVYWFANDFPGAKAEEEFNQIHFVRGGGKGTSILKAVQWYRRQEPFHLVIDQHHGIPWFAPWWCDTNCVAYIHEVLGPIWSVFYPGLPGAVGRLQERWTHWLYRNVPFWVPSASTRQGLHAHGVRDVTVVPNGCDTAPLAMLDPKPLLPPVRLVVVSRLAPNKRVDHVIRALKMLLDGGISASLSVVGRGEAETEIRQLVASLGLSRQVVFTGSLSEDDKNTVLRQAHFLLHTSVREGWGLNVLEANAMGTPAAVYPVAGLVDSTLHGQTGWVVANETPCALANAVTAVLRDPETYNACRVRAWRRAGDHAWDRVLPSACDWLERCAASRKARTWRG